MNLSFTPSVVASSARSTPIGPYFGTSNSENGAQLVQLGCVEDDRQLVADLLASLSMRTLYGAVPVRWKRSHGGAVLERPPAAGRGVGAVAEIGLHLVDEHHHRRRGVRFHRRDLDHAGDDLRLAPSSPGRRLSPSGLRGSSP
jgi:hypothetical protein